MTLGLRFSGTTSNKSCVKVSWIRPAKARALAYLVHAPNDSEVGGRLVLRCDKDAVPLCSGEIDHVGLGLLGIDAIDFDNPHRVVFEPKILCCKRGYVDDAEHIRLPWFHVDLQVLSLVHQGRVRHRLSPSWVSVADKATEQTGHLVMIPV